ncbi:MAG: triple tyrosine motif-containing protein [Capnocytophaga sp.]|nr:triple tyrosine motif-containing protein [Capnocytophaga sp.]
MTARRQRYITRLWTAWLCFWAAAVSAQFDAVGFVPPAFHFTQREYHSGTQNWGVSQTENGVVYVANNKGLLSFDGRKWQLHHVQGRKIVRSVWADDESGRVYVGSFEEFGYFEKKADGQLAYHSLSSLLSAYHFQNDEIWTIVTHAGKIYFQSFASYFVYDGHSVRAYKPEPAPFGMFAVGGMLYMQAIDGDFYTFENEKWTSVVDRKLLANTNVVAVFALAEGIGLVTDKGGIFRYLPQAGFLQKIRTQADRQLSEAVINRALRTHSGDMVLGTLTGGVYVLDSEGNIRWHIDQSNGLGNNTVLGICEDKQQNLWVALDDGVSYINSNSELRYHELHSDIGLVEGMEVYDDTIYLVSNKGLYTLNTESGNAVRLPGFDSQVWFAKRMDKQLFVGHNKGTSVITGSTIRELEQVGVGGMDIKKGVIHGQEVLVESSYTFITIYLKSADGIWYPSHNIENFSDLIDRVEVDPSGNIWANHVHKGVYRIQLQDDLRHIRKMEEWHQMDSLGGGALQLLSLRGNPVFADGMNFYVYDQEQQTVKVSEYLSSELSALTRTKRIIPVSDYKFWFITDSDYNWVVYEGGQYRTTARIPFGSIAKPSNEERATVYVAASGQSYFCLNGSIARYVPSQQHEGYGLALASLTSFNRKEDVKVLEPLTSPIRIDYSKNNVAFEFQYPDYSRQRLRLRYYLEGYDRQWSESAEFTVDYQQLPQGDYVLRAFVINSVNDKLSQIEIPFSITTPWYRSVVAYVVYGILSLALAIGLLSLYFYLKIRQREKEYAQEQARRNRMLEQQEKEITTLRNEKLEAELVHKSKALAGATMMNVKNDEFLEKLLIDFQQFLDTHKIARRHGTAITHHIREHISKEDEWQMFQENFDMIHKNFFRNLKLKYPNLTASDLRLCVLLRLNYATKEIASMQGVSVRGVETARYRLRKKLNLSEEESLTDFLISFQ